MQNKNLSSQKRGTLILTFALAVALAVSGCAKKETPKPVVNNNNNNNAQQVNQNTNTNANLNQNTNPNTSDGSGVVKNGEEIDTSDWQTYRNEEYGYQIKYPKNWHMSFPQGYGKEIPRGQVVRIAPTYDDKDIFNVDDPYYAPLDIVAYDEEIPDSININNLKETQGIIHNNVKFIKENGMFYYVIKNDNLVVLTTIDSFKDEEKGKKMFETIVFGFEFID